MHKIFRFPKFSEILSGSPEIFRHCETEKVSTGNSEIPCLCVNFSNTRSFLKPWRFLPRNILHCQTKSFRGKIVIAPHPISYPEIFFDTRKFLKHRRDSLRSFLILSDRKFLRKPWCPLSCIGIFDIRILLKHRSVPPRIFLALWDNKNTTKPWCPVLCITLFETWNFLKHRRVSSWISSALSNKKKFNRK